MLRITTNQTPLGIEMKLEGKLVQSLVASVRTASDAMPSSSPRRLDLSDLMFVDRAGEQLLRELLEAGFQLAGCSNYVAELLHARTA